MRRRYTVLAILNTVFLRRPVISPAGGSVRDYPRGIRWLGVRWLQMGTYGGTVRGSREFLRQLSPDLSILVDWRHDASTPADFCCSCTCPPGQVAVAVGDSSSPHQIRS